MRALAIILGLSSITFGAQAQGAGYLGRPLTLPAGHGRIDLGPPDWGYMEHGALNNGRGLRLVVPPFGDTQVFLGAGGGYGITDQLEVGGLVLPLQLADDTDLGDLEAYLRYAFAPGGNLAVQGTLRIPTATELGLGIGIPIFVSLGGESRLETGFELELIFYDDTLVNLDVPAAFQFALGSDAYIGPRTGLVVVDLEEVAINLGGQIGVTINSMVELSGGVNFPRFLWTGPGDAVNVDWVEVVLAATFHL
jgi:hypothetical protein